MFTTVDCILVDYNQQSYDAYAQRLKADDGVSAAYSEVKTNSVLLDGLRWPYMELLDRAVTAATGAPQGLDLFRVPSLGVCYLKSFLARRGLSSEIINEFSRETDRQRLKALLAAKSYVVAISTTFYISDIPIADIVRFVREHAPEATVVVGGPYIYHLGTRPDDPALARSIANTGAVLYVVDSQGEQTLAKLVEHLKAGGDRFDLSAIPNLLYRGADGALRTTEVQAEDNSMDGNAVDWDMFDPALLQTVAFVRTSRSCPFSCAFCNHPTLAGPFTLRSVEDVELELDQLERIGAKAVIFVDDSLNIPVARFKTLLLMMIRKNYSFQ